jgi:anti-sigma factor (TIGR02949 family)
VKDCDAARHVSPYLDGELAPDERAAFEAHARGCAICSHALEQERLVIRAVAASLPLHEAPSGLRARVQHLLDVAAPATATPAGRRREWRTLGQPAVLAASLLACVLAGLALWRGAAVPPAGADTASGFAALAVDSHLRHARGQLPLEVRDESPAVVSAFFAGRLPFHLALPDYPLEPGETKAYHLEGGRLVGFAGDYAAFVAYRMDGRPISLLVTSAERARPEGGEVVAAGALTFHLQSVAGLKVIIWSDKGLTYALASDLAVTGSRSCLVCHGSAEERRKLEAL